MAVITKRALFWKNSGTPTRSALCILLLFFCFSPREACQLFLRPKTRQGPLSHTARYVSDVVCCAAALGGSPIYYLQLFWRSCMRFANILWFIHSLNKVKRGLFSVCLFCTTSSIRRFPHATIGIGDRSVVKQQHNRH